MMTSSEELLQTILKEISELPVIEAGEIPNIDLYMDQVTTFMEDRLAAYRRNDDDKILTKTMINNYAKNHLLPPPEKKKYSREHMLVLIFIYYFKSVLSLQDIQSVLEPITGKYFGKDADISLVDIYNQVFSYSDVLAQRIADDVDAYAQSADAVFPDAPEEDRTFIRYFTLICSLCVDIYVKKKVVEKLIDGHAPAEADTAAKTAGSSERRKRSAT